MRTIVFLLVAAASAALAGWERKTATDKMASQIVGGDPGRGRTAIARHGCASCHTIPGVAGAEGNVGPPLNRMGGRVYIAGVLVNTPENMIRWISNPPQVNPLTAMPNVGASEAEVKDIASFLYTLR